MMKNVPSIIQRMLERPPILVDEDRAEFGDLFEMVCDDEQPQTTQEWLLVADIACADFEIFRLRGLKVRAFHAGLTETWQIEIDDRTEYVDLEGRPVKLNWQAPLRKLVVGALAGNVSSKAAMTNYLERRGLTMESLVGATFAEITGWFAVDGTERRSRECARRSARGCASDSVDVQASSVDEGH